jgi:2-polyprenyl-3-methyl-5-hydroxy-6-metoxy-1,4-benzoquinol methylase
MVESTITKTLHRAQLASVIDIGCGTGRHSIELTKRGYKVIGIDLSESQLERAREKAKAQNLQIDFQKYDARKLPFKNEYNLAIMLCEGAFPLMETDEMNYEILKNVAKSLKDSGKLIYEILKNVAKSLKDSGKLIFTTLNGLFPLYHSVEEFCTSTTEEGNTTCRSNTFDLMTFRDHNITTVEDDFGNKKELECNERYYVPSEITWLLKTLGFKKIDIYGAKLGAFSRNDKLRTEDFEMLVIAEK